MISIIWSLSTGAVEIQFSNVVKILLNNLRLSSFDISSQEEQILLALRLPRIEMAIMVGSALGVAGTVMQGLFRNQLADPALIGVSNGAAAGAAAMIVLGYTFALESVAIQNYTLPIAAFIGGMIAVIIAYRLSTRGSHTSVGILLLTGIAINAITTSIIGFFIFISTDAQLRSITFWLLGSISYLNREIVTLSAPFIVMPVIFMLFYGRHLNAFSLGEKEAFFMGYNTEKIKKILLLLLSISIGASVAFTGVIGFIGLLVPHIVKFFTGPDNRIVLPVSFFAGAILLIIADTFSRTLMSPAEIPVGILTTGIGGPVFLYLLLREKSKQRI